MSKADSIRSRNFHFTQNKFINNIFHEAINSVQKSPDVAIDPLNGKSERPYLPYQGKIIRHIYIDPFDFDRSLDDTLKRDNSLGTRIGKRLHYTTRRLSLQLETEFYLKKKILGFHFAPFPYGDFTLITPDKSAYNKSDLYMSVGGGLRARNENLIFQTIELRAYYFPIAPTNMEGFKVIVTSNVRFRYTSDYVTEPDVVQLNAE